jgi:GMP synthase-like glutamine amidotransferase
MKHVSVVQHTQSEWLGHIEDHLEARGVRFGYVRPFVNGGQIPTPMNIGDGLILVGGGRWGAASPEHLLPTLDAEVRLARACLMLDKPVMGIGLGAQILSLAAEGRVEATPFSFTVGKAVRISDDALSGFLPESFPSVVYMRDWPVPPDYAQILATDQDGRPSLFQIGPNAFGFAGHPGLRRAMIEDLMMEFDEAPPEAASALRLLGNISNSIEDALVPIMTGVVRLTGWMG